MVIEFNFRGERSTMNVVQRLSGTSKIVDMKLQTPLTDGQAQFDIHANEFSQPHGRDASWGTFWSRAPDPWRRNRRRRTELFMNFLLPLENCSRLWVQNR